MDSSRKRKFCRRKRQELNEKRRLRRARKALDAEAKGLRKRGPNKRSRELWHKANGKPLAKEVLEECMLNTLALAEHYNPVDQDGNERMGVNPTTGAAEPAGDAERSLDLLEATARFAAWLAPYQSPKLSATASAEATSDIAEKTSFIVNIFNARGEHVATSIDGEVVEHNEQAGAATTPPDET